MASAYSLITTQYPAQLLRLLQYLRNARRPDAELFQHMRRRYVLAEHYSALKQAMLFTLGERGETRKRMHPRLLDHVQEIPFARIVPPDQCQIRTLRIPDGISCKARVGDQPPLVDVGGLVVGFAQVIVARFDIESVLDIRRSAGVIMELCFYPDTPAVLLSEHIHFVLCATPCERHASPRLPAVRA